MFAIFNLQLTASLPMEGGSAIPAQFQPVAAVLPAEPAVDFAELLQVRADTRIEAAVPRGEFVPQDGKQLPPLTQVPADPTPEPVVDALPPHPQAGSADVDDIVINAVWPTAPSQTAGAPQPQLTLSPQSRQPVPLTAAVPGTKTVTPRRETPPPNVAAVLADSDRVIARLPRNTVPAMAKPPTAELTQSIAIAPQLRDATQIDVMKKVRLPATGGTAEATAVAQAPSDAVRSMKVTEANFVRRLAPAGDAASLADRPPPLNSAMGPAPVSEPLQSINAQMQVATPRDAGLLSGATPDLVRTPVTAPDWGDRIGERVRMLAGKQTQHAEIRLTPAELGPLRVRIALEEGAANVSFHAHHPVTREAIEAAMPRLREMLAENGLSLGDASVSGDGVAQGQRERREASQLGSSPGAETDVADEQSAERQKPVESDALIDTFV